MGGLALVIGFALAPFALDRIARERVPEPSDMETAAQAVRTGFRDGDAVRVEPSWWTLPWAGLVGMGGGTETWPFPALLRAEGFDPVEALGHRRLWVIGWFGRAADLPDEIAGAGRLEAEVVRGARVRVAVWALDQVPRVRTLTAELAALKVTRGDKSTKTCAFRAGKHRCGGRGWQDVGLERRVVWQREVTWLYAHPGQGAEGRVEVAWEGLEREVGGGAAWVYLRIGESLGAVRNKDGGPVTVRVLVDGVERDSFQLAPHRFWMERRAYRLGGAGDGGATFAVQIESDQSGWRETLLEADLMGEPGPALRRWATRVVE